MSAEDHFHHVRDFGYLELPFGNRVELPRIPLPEFLGGEWQITKFMLLQVVAAAVCISAGRLVLLQLQCASNAPRKLGVAASAVQLAGSGIRGCDRQCKYSQRAGSGSGAAAA